MRVALGLGGNHPFVSGESNAMAGVIFIIFMLWLLFKVAGFALGIAGKILGGILGIIGYLILGILAVTAIGLSVIALPVILIVGVVCVAGLIAKA